MTHRILRTDIMRREIRTITMAAAPGLAQCVWSPFRAPRPARPYAEWRPITQPGGAGHIRDEEESLTLTRQADIQVLNAVDGEQYRISYNYSSATVTAGPASTVTTIRDALVTLVNADREPLTASAVSTDVIRLTGDADGAMWRCSGRPGFFDVTETVGSATDYVELQRSMLRMTATLNVYSDSTATADESALFAHQIDSAFRSREVNESLEQSHLSVMRIAEPVNLDGITPSGTDFESRTAIDFAIYLPFWVGQSIAPIESVEGLVQVTGADDAPISVSI